MLKLRSICASTKRSWLTVCECSTDDRWECRSRLGPPNIHWPMSSCWPNNEGPHRGRKQLKAATARGDGVSNSSKNTSLGCLTATFRLFQTKRHLGHCQQIGGDKEVRRTRFVVCYPLRIRFGIALGLVGATTECETGGGWI